jgi:hypothetical protein
MGDFQFNLVWRPSLPGRQVRQRDDIGILRGIDLPTASFFDYHKRYYSMPRR